MKQIILLALAGVVMHMPAQAQQAPRAAEAQLERAPRVTAVQPNRSVPAPSNVLMAPAAPRTTDPELAELLRAQTAAIKTLSSKIDTLEERIGRMEQGKR